MREPYFTDAEHRILLSAISREEKVCQEISIDLVAVCGSIERKVYRLQHPEIFPDAYDPCTGTGQIFSLD